MFCGQRIPLSREAWDPTVNAELSTGGLKVDQGDLGEATTAPLTKRFLFSGEIKQEPLKSEIVLHVVQRP